MVGDGDRGEAGPDEARSRRLRRAFGLTGVTIALAAYLGGGRPNVFLFVVLAVAVAPYLVYMVSVRTSTVSVLAGVALLIMPILAYGDFYLDRFRGVNDGFNFGFVTVPLMNIAITGAALAIDRMLLGRR